MKKLLLLALLAMIMVGCKENTNNDRNYATDEREYTYKVLVIDSCEYIRISGFYGLSHKGNCRFCAERNKRMVHQQVDSILLDIFE